MSIAESLPCVKEEDSLPDHDVLLWPESTSMVLGFCIPCHHTHVGVILDHTGISSPESSFPEGDMGARGKEKPDQLLIVPHHP